MTIENLKGSKPSLVKGYIKENQLKINHCV